MYNRGMSYRLKYACVECKKRSSTVRPKTRCKVCGEARRKAYKIAYDQKDRPERARLKREQSRPVERPICSQIELYRAEKLARTERGPGTLAMQVYMEVMRELGESKERKTRQPMGKAA